LKRCHEEDLEQLEALGWKTSGFIRWENRWYSKLEPLQDLAVPEEETHPTDLKWVLEGDERTAHLTAHERYCLHVLAETGSPYKAATSTDGEKWIWRQVYSDLMSMLYKTTPREG